MITPYEIIPLIRKYRDKAAGLKLLLKDGYADGTPLNEKDEIEVTAQLHEIDGFLEDLGEMN